MGEGNRTLKFQDENLVTITNLSTPTLKEQWLFALQTHIEMAALEGLEPSDSSLRGR